MLLCITKWSFWLFATTTQNNNLIVLSRRGIPKLKLSQSPVHSYERLKNRASSSYIQRPCSHHEVTNLQFLFLSWSKLSLAQITLPMSTSIRSRTLLQDPIFISDPISCSLGCTHTYFWNAANLPMSTSIRLRTLLQNISRYFCFPPCFILALRVTWIFASLSLVRNIRSM
jgi:hypothetical protein